MGAELVMTLVAPGSGAGALELRQRFLYNEEESQDYSRADVHESQPEAEGT